MGGIAAQAPPGSAPSGAVAAFARDLPAHVSLHGLVVVAARAGRASAAALAGVSADGSAIELLATTGLSDAAVRRSRRLPVSTDCPLAEAVATRSPVLVRGSLLPDELGTGSAVVLPLLAGERLLAVLGFAFAAARIQPAKEAELGALAVAVARALDDLGRGAVEQRARSLQDLTAALAPLDTTAAIGEAILDGSLDVLGAAAGSVTLLDSDRAHLRWVATRGYRSEIVAAFDPVPLDLPSPFAEAVRAGELVLVETSEEFDELYPGVRTQRGEPAQFAVAAVPLAVDGPVFGALGLSFESPRLFQEGETAFMLALARLCSQALDRARRGRLYDAATRLQAVTVELARAVTENDVGRVIVEEVAQSLGAARGRLIRGDPERGAVRTVALSGIQDDMTERLSGTPELGKIPYAVAIDGGRPVLIPSLRAAAAEWPVALREFGRLGLDAVAAFPLPGRERPLGAIAFAWTEPRTFSDEDVRYLGAIAGVSAQALERAWAYEQRARTEARLRHLLDHLGEAVLLVDGSLAVTYANAEAAALFGEASLIGGTLPDRWPELRLAELARTETRSEAEPVEERVALREDGRTFDVLAMPQESGVLLILRDVSRRERQERAEREFIANAAHELRSPLAAIGSATDALQRGAKDLPAERDYFLAGIAGEVERLAQLTDALLLLARAQAEPASVEQVRLDLDPVVTAVAARLDVRPGVRVTVDGEAGAIFGDEALFTVALGNVARNAARHTERGSIAFSCRADGSTVAVAVADTGPGMNEEVRRRAVTRFFRGGSRDRSGFGLGLPIATAMVEALGGELTIESRPGAGTTVTMTFPAAS